MIKLNKYTLQIILTIAVFLMAEYTHAQIKATMCYTSSGGHIPCGQTWQETRNNVTYSCTCNCNNNPPSDCFPQSGNPEFHHNPSSNPLNSLNQGLDMLMNAEESQKERDRVIEENKRRQKEAAIEKKALEAEKYENVKSQFKSLDDNDGKQKASCLKAQREVYRLLTLKIKFENQLYDLKKWSNNLDDLSKGFTDDKNTYTSGITDDLLNLIPIDYIKSVTPALQAEKIEKALSATKMLKASVENALQLKENLNSDTVFNKMNLANQSYTYAGQMIEGASVFADKKYKTTFEQAGRCLQMNGASLGMVKDNSNEDIGNAVVDAVGLFVPPASLTAAGTRIALKTAYEIYSDWQIHKLSTTKSENLKAQEFLKSKIEELDNGISLNQAIVDEYKKANPAGCPVY